MSTFDSTKTQLSKLLDEITEGKIQLPDFQRGWIWDDEHIRSLMISIARLFPIGAVMLLENGGEAKFKVRPIEGVMLDTKHAYKAERLVLDGQQRLTSLTQVLKLDKPVTTTDSNKKAIKRYYYIDIKKALEGHENYEEAFFGVEEDRVLRENFGRDIKKDLSTREREYELMCFPCSQILNSDDWEEGLHEYAPEKFQLYMVFRKQILNNFRNYDVPVIELKKDNKKEAVCLVFEKVNTGGVPLSIFELLTATYAAETDNVNLRDEWYGNKSEGIIGYKERLNKLRLLKSIEPTDFLQGLSLLHTFEKRKNDLLAGKTGKQVTGVSAKREAMLNLPLSAYQFYKEKLFNGYVMVARFLRGEAFYTHYDLPYNTQLIPLAALLTMLGERWQEPIIRSKITKWFWNGVLGELYGGSSETRISLDIQELMDWILDDGEEPSTIRTATFNADRLNTLRSRNSAAYKGISVLIQREGARDFFWKVKINDLSETDWEENRLDIHHIFPKDWCIKNGIPASSYNSILNKTAISYKANRKIGNKAPSVYLRQLQEHENVQLSDDEMDEILISHCIEPITLRLDAYTEFIESRAELIIKNVEAAIGKNVVRVKGQNEVYVNGEEEDQS
jgi:hypothetical protein